MKRSRRILTILFVLAGLSAAGSVLIARAGEPCITFGFKSGEVLEIPCPRDLAEALDLPLFQPKPRDGDGFHIQPDIPDDRDMVIDPGWRHDRGIDAEPYDDRPPAGTRLILAPPAS
jgi:hypothetical protein